MPTCPTVHQSVHVVILKIFFFFFAIKNKNFFASEQKLKCWNNKILKELTLKSYFFLS